MNATTQTPPRHAAAAARRAAGGASAPRGFTLIEMVTSCLVLSMVMLALGYGLKLALVSTGNGASQSAQTLEASDLVERVTDDLNLAIHFTEKTANAVEFTVPDREGGDADARPDKIRYEWWPTAGTIPIPGTPTTTTTTTTSDGGGGLIGGLLGGLLGLGGGGTTTTTTTTTTGDTVIPVPAHSFTRRVNDGAPALVARDVRQFDLKYLYRTMTPPPATEKLLFAYEGGTSTAAVNSEASVGLTFVPATVMPGVASFRITRVQFYLRVDYLESAFGSAVESAIYTTFSGATPTGTPTGALVSNQVAEVGLNRSLTDFQWVDFHFANAPTLSAASGLRYGIGLRIGTGTPGGTTGLLNEAATVAYASFAGSPAKAGTAYTTKASRLGAWSTPNTSHSLRYRVYGVTTP